MKQLGEIHLEIALDLLSLGTVLESKISFFMIASEYFWGISFLSQGDFL